MQSPTTESYSWSCVGFYGNLW